VTLTTGALPGMSTAKETFSNENPTCFGKSPDRLPVCAQCRYLAGCRWYADNPPPKHPYSRESGKRHHQTIDVYDGEATAVADPHDFETEGEDDSTLPVYSRQDLEQLLHFLLYEIDQYSLSAALVMLRGGHQSIAETARVFGVGREAMRRKLGDACRRHPPLAQMLKAVMSRCAKLSDTASLDSVEGRRKPRNGHSQAGQLEINFM